MPSDIAPETAPEAAPEISIVVANWNGEAFLAECLGSLGLSARAAGRPFELIVVDDASGDGSAGLIREGYPEVRLFENQRNAGFARTCNLGAREARGRVLVMVNNDVCVPEGFIARLTAPFFAGRGDGAPLFAVAARTEDEDAPNQLCMTAAWRRGGIGKTWSDPQTATSVTYVQGGAAAYDRAMFLRLGGFDALFHPGYWEDYDLSYRACRVGWRALYEPAAAARHVGGASMGRRYSAGYLAQIEERNRLWFNWLHLDADLLLVRHLCALPWIYGRDVASGRGVGGILGFLRAAAGAARVLGRRRRRRQEGPRTVRRTRDLLAP